MPPKRRPSQKNCLNWVTQLAKFGFFASWRNFWQFAYSTFYKDGRSHILYERVAAERSISHLGAINRLHGTWFECSQARTDGDVKPVQHDTEQTQCNQVREWRPPGAARRGFVAHRRPRVAAHGDAKEPKHCFNPTNVKSLVRNCQVNIERWPTKWRTRPGIQNQTRGGAGSSSWPEKRTIWIASSADGRE